MRAMQGSVLRVNVIWSRAVAPAQAGLARKPAQVLYDWARYDSIVDLARGHGMAVQMTITGPAPAWATPTGDLEKGYVRPNARRFGEFARAVAERYRGRVSRYSIWNEPNWATWLGPLSEGPRLYRELYRRSYAAIKRADPNADVLIGELAPYRKGTVSTAPLEFLREMTCVDAAYRPTRRRCPGGTLKADGFAHHPYDFTNPPERPLEGADNVTIGSLDRLTRALDRLKRARVLVPRRGRYLPLYLTEFGYFRAGARRISESKRAAWTTRAFDIAQRNPRVRQILYYVFVRPPGGTFFDLSLLDTDGRETGAYRALVRWGADAAAQGRIRKPGRKRDGVTDAPPPPPEPPAEPPPGGDPPPEEPPCPIPPIPC
jgi:hypothetical protein